MVNGTPFALALTVTRAGSPHAAAIAVTSSGCPSTATKLGAGDSIQACGLATQRTAAPMSRRPPVAVESCRDVSESTVERRSALMPRSLAPGSAALASAAAPETCGAAIDVPLR
jgi:hypothetical protein